MKKQLHYATVTDAINQLRAQGFTTDFNVEGDALVCHAGQISDEEFDIVDIYRYEGNSDPGDEAIVYAIESTSGIKGILVAGYGSSSDIASTKILKKLNSRK